MLPAYLPAVALPSPLSSRPLDTPRTPALPLAWPAAHGPALATVGLALLFAAWELAGSDRWLADMAGNAGGFPPGAGGGGFGGGFNAPPPGRMMPPPMRGGGPAFGAPGWR